MTALERQPWKDGIDSTGLWTYSSQDRFTRKSIRNDALWSKISEAREELIAKAIVWRERAIADGWSSRPTYEHESELTAFTLERDGFKVQGIARPSKPDSMGHAEISCWGPDRLHIPISETYDWDALQRAVETCGYCGGHPVKTERVGFAGRCCATCLPTMRARIEVPGWAE